MLRENWRQISVPAERFFVGSTSQSQRFGIEPKSF